MKIQCKVTSFYKAKFEKNSKWEECTHVSDALNYYATIDFELKCEMYIVSLSDDNITEELEILKSVEWNIGKDVKQGNRYLSFYGVTFTYDEKSDTISIQNMILDI